MRVLAFLTAIVFAAGCNDSSDKKPSGTTWAQQPIGTSDTYIAVHGDDAGTIYVAGEGSRIWIFSQGQWKSSAHPVTTTIHGVYVLPDGSFTYFVGTDGWFTYRDNALASQGSANNGLAVQSTANPLPIYMTVWAASSSSVLGMGSFGQYFRFDGTSANWAKFPFNEAILGLHGFSATDVYLVGTNTLIARFDGSQWIGMVNQAPGTLTDIWGASPSDLWAVGLAGKVLHYDGATWNATTAGTTADLYGVHGRSASDVYAVGKGGTILHWNGSAWQNEDSGTSEDFRDVWVSPSGRACAVGTRGTVLLKAP